MGHRWWQRGIVFHGGEVSHWNRNVWDTGVGSHSINFMVGDSHGRRKKLCDTLGGGPAAKENSEIYIPQLYSTPP